MTKAEVIGHIKSLLPREDDTNKYHDNVIAAGIERVFNQIFYTMALKNERELDDYSTSYGEATAITVTEDSTTGMYSSTLPAQIVPLPWKRSGVIGIYTAEEGEVAFHPMTRKEAELAPNTLYGLVGSRIGYIVRGSRVDYYNMNSTVAAAGVRMDLIVPFTDLASTDEVKFPYGYDMDIVNAVVELGRSIPPVDLKDNNSDG